MHSLPRSSVLFKTKLNLEQLFYAAVFQEISTLANETLADILLRTKISVWKPQTVVKLHVGAYYLGKTCKCQDHLVPLPVLFVLLLIHVG